MANSLCMKSVILSFLTRTSVAFALIITAQAAQIYTLGGSGNFVGNTSFGVIDSVTGAYSVIDADMGGAFLNLAPAPNNAGTFYTVGAGTGDLFHMDESGNLSSSIGSTGVGTMFGLAYRASDNILYGCSYNSDMFGTVNPTTAAWTETTLSQGTSVPAGGHFAILDDVWYATWTDGTFGSVTFNSPVFSTIGSNSLYSEMVLATDGTTLNGIAGAHSSGGAKLYSINIANGSLTTIASITGGAPQYYFGAGIAAVPEPSTCALLGLGGVTLLLIARRKKA